MRKIHKGKHGAKRDPCPGLFEGLSQRSASARFIVFHKTCRKCPVAVSRLNGPSAHENAAFPLDQRTDDNFRVLVVDGAALVADMAWQAVASRDLETDLSTAMGTVVHDSAETWSAFDSNSRSPPFMRVQCILHAFS